jgi:hypothetical protein
MFVGLNCILSGYRREIHIDRSHFAEPSHSPHKEMEIEFTRITFKYGLRGTFDIVSHRINEY